MNTVRIRAASTLLLLTLVVVAGCGGGEPTNTGASGNSSGGGGTTNAGTTASVKLMLNWFPEAEHGGYYAALVHGYYKEAGLEVEIVPGGPNAPVVPQTARGAVEFGVTNADRILMARAEGAKVKALMAPLQTSPRCVLVHEDSGIESLTDLKDMTLMMRRENAWAQFLLTKLKNNNVTVAPNTASLAPFLKNPRSAKQGYVISEPFVAKREGAKVRSLMVADIGFNPYSSVLMTADSYNGENADLVRKFVNASIRGWKKYLESPEETNAHINKLNPEMSVEVLRFGVDAIKEHCLGDVDRDALGTMTAERWRTLVEQLETLKLIDAGSVPYTEAFTEAYVVDTQ